MLLLYVQMCDEMLKVHRELTLLWETIWEVTEDKYGLWDLTSLGSSLPAL